MSNQDFYIYFEKSSGNIKKISGKVEETTEDTFLIKVFYDQVKDIYEGRKSFNDYVISYDIKRKEYALILKGNAFKNYDVNEYLFKVPINIKNSDIKITQNFKKQAWQIKLNRRVAKKIINDGFKSYANLFFSVTKRDDPNIIYRSFKLDIQELIDQSEIIFPFTSNKEITNLLSLYTNKYFDTYSYKVKYD
jgi:hypothetical protein